MNRTDQCPARQGGLVPALGCTCDGNAHTCAPRICTMGWGGYLSQVSVAWNEDDPRRNLGAEVAGRLIRLDRIILSGR